MVETPDSGDVAAILASYEAHEAKFQKLTGKGELGRKDKQDPKTNIPLPLLPQTTPSKVTHKEFWDAGVIGMVNRVSWGTYHGNSASAFHISQPLLSLPNPS